MPFRKYFELTKLDYTIKELDGLAKRGNMSINNFSFKQYGVPLLQLLTGKLKWLQKIKKKIQNGTKKNDEFYLFKSPAKIIINAPLSLVGSCHDNHNRQYN